MGTYYGLDYHIKSIEVYKDKSRPEGWLYAAVTVTFPSIKDPRRCERVIEIPVNGDGASRTTKKVYQELRHLGFDVQRHELPHPISHMPK